MSPATSFPNINTSPGNWSQAVITTPVKMPSTALSRFLAEMNAQTIPWANVQNMPDLSFQGQPVSFQQVQAMPRAQALTQGYAPSNLMPAVPVGQVGIVQTSTPSANKPEGVLTFWDVEREMTKYGVSKDAFYAHSWGALFNSPNDVGEFIKAQTGVNPYAPVVTTKILTPIAMSPAANAASAMSQQVTATPQLIVPPVPAPTFHQEVEKFITLQPALAPKGSVSAVLDEMYHVPPTGAPVALTVKDVMIEMYGEKGYVPKLAAPFVPGVHVTGWGDDLAAAASGAIDYVADQAAGAVEYVSDLPGAVVDAVLGDSETSDASAIGGTVSETMNVEQRVDTALNVIDATKTAITTGVGPEVKETEAEKAQREFDKITAEKLEASRMRATGSPTAVAGIEGEVVRAPEDTPDNPQGGQVYPVTPAERLAAVALYLKKSHPEGEGEGGDNQLILKYFSDIVPEMSQGEIDYKILAKAARSYETFILDHDWDFEDRVVLQQQLVDFNKDLITWKIPPIVIRAFNAGIYSTLKEHPNTQYLADWMNAGGILENIQNDTIFNLITDSKDFLKSDAGLTAVGGALTAIGVAGAWMALGPIGGIAASQQAVFGITELKQNFGSNPYITIGALQLKGEYAKDHAGVYDQMMSGATGVVTNIGMAKSLSNPQVNKENIAAGETAVKDAQALLRDDYVYFMAMNTYDGKLARMKALEAALKTNKAQFDASGNFIAKDVPPVAFHAMNIPVGYKVEFGGKKLEGKLEGDVIKSSETLDSLLTITRPDGTVITGKAYKLTPYGGDVIVDIGGVITLADQYADRAALKISNYEIKLEAGAQIQIGDKIFDPVNWERTVLLDGKEGDQTEYKISKPGFEDKYGTAFFKGIGTTKLSPILKTSFAAGQEAIPAGYVSFKGLDPKSKVMIDGVEVDAATLMGLQGVKGKDVSYVIEVTQPGYKPVSQRITIKDGDNNIVSLQGMIAVENKVEQGGSSGGASSMAGPVPVKPPSTITFGLTFSGARIWLNTIAVQPLMNTPYAVPTGYNAVTATKAGFEPYAKTVYCAAEVNLHVEHSWVATAATPPAETPTAQPIIGDDETKAYIIFAQAVSGCYVYLDGARTEVVIGTKYVLNPGYHAIKLSKSGKEDWYKNVTLAAGDVLTISPVLTDASVVIPVVPAGSTPTTKRVFINTTLDGAKILINGGFTGQWTPAYLDLERGFYTLGIQKAGYTTQNSFIWVGDTIAFGDTALALARVNGWDV